MSDESGSGPINEGRDRRVDRVLQVALGLACTVALSAGAWFFKGLAEEMRELNKAVAELRTEVRVQAERGRRVEEVEGDVEKLKDRVTRLEIYNGRNR